MWNYLDNQAQPMPKGPQNDPRAHWHQQSGRVPTDERVLGIWKDQCLEYFVNRQKDNPHTQSLEKNKVTVCGLEHGAR